MTDEGNSVHKNWVKITHWIGTISFFALTVSGFAILMVHPRLYWGETGNDLTPALLELPISRNHQHDGWTKDVAFFERSNSPVSASRTYEIFNENSWGRSLHFLSAWVLVATGAFYIISALVTKHLQRNLVPGRKERNIHLFLNDIINHIKFRIPVTTGGPHYGLLQKTTYLCVLLFLVPVMVLTGLTMSPAVTAAYPFLLAMFFGAQSARTIHFLVAVVLVIFLIMHLIMIIKSGFKDNIRSMTVGKMK